ncbi:MAG: glycerate kinase [Thermodesulfobacteriota bacterium]
MFRAGVAAAEPGECVRRALEMEGPDCMRACGQSFFLPDFDRVLLVAAGKAACPMAEAALSLLGGRVSGGIAVTKYGHAAGWRRLPVREAGHPLPDEAGLAAAREVLSVVSSAGPRDLVLFLFSGGASALLSLPAPGISLKDKIQTTSALLASGAPIAAMNAVRKHLSAIKGGRLAQACPESDQITLALSDVIGDDLSVIASGPTFPDSSTFSECLGIVDGYGLSSALPAQVLDRLRAGARGELPETPKPGDPAFSRSCFRVAGSLAQSLEAVMQKARSLGFHPFLLSPEVSGEAREAARSLCGLARQAQAGEGLVPLPAVIVAGGETTVTLRGKGLGGRNQEMALAAALELDGLPGLGLLACGTDGTDGPTDAAGAWSDGTTAPRARFRGLDPATFLGNNDSHSFFRQAGGLVHTGPTGTNVMDIYLALAGGRE